MIRYLWLMLLLAGCGPSTPARSDGLEGIVPAGAVQRVEVTPDEAAAIRGRTIYAGAFMRYHAFVSETGTVEFWHEGRLLATIDDRGVIRYAPVVLSMTPGAAAGRDAGSGLASFDDSPALAIVKAAQCRARSKEVPCVLSSSFSRQPSS
ncbi:MAG: hypothetical protein OXH08_16785 [Gammaproteobacteria bacterium]|nr:hypothetical protein [Gammaproteobacteria bacterium]MYC52054.1 hypothetical protein [Gammaproteobacteria bacterium]